MYQLSGIGSLGDYPAMPPISAMPDTLPAISIPSPGVPYEPTVQDLPYDEENTQVATTPIYPDEIAVSPEASASSWDWVTEPSYPNNGYIPTQPTQYYQVSQSGMSTEVALGISALMLIGALVAG